jgi:hypothetical protein
MKIRGYYVKSGDEFVAPSREGYPWWSGEFHQAQHFSTIPEAQRVAEYALTAYQAPKSFEIVKAEINFTSIDNVTIAETIRDELVTKAKNTFSDKELSLIAQAIHGKQE